MRGPVAFRRSTWLLSALSACVLLGCSVKPPKQQGDTPITASDDNPESPSKPSGPSEGSTPSHTPSSGGTEPSTKDDKNALPDDYELTPRDCIELGNQFALLIKADESQKLSPKLKEKQREAAEQSIQKAASARGQQWTDSCQKSLVGMVSDRKALKCAMDAKNVKAFDDCLNVQKK
jgi:hypothetical protein